MRPIALVPLVPGNLGVFQLAVATALSQAFDVPFTTASTGTIRGGIALNTIPAECEFVFEFRNLPGVDPEAILTRIQGYVSDVLVPKMRAENVDAGMVISKIAAAPSHDAAESDAITQLVRALTADRRDSALQLQNLAWPPRRASRRRS